MAPDPSDQPQTVSSRTQFLGPARVAMIYAAMATAWIVASDSLVGMIFDDPWHVAVVSAYKGLAFVVLTTLVLYRLMRHMVGNLTMMHRRVEAEQAAKLQALALLEVIAEKSTDAIYVKDVAGRYLLLNREAERFIGKDSSQVLGRDDRSVFLPGEAEALMEADRRLMEGGEVRTYEEVLTTPLGVCTFLTTKGPLHDETGQLTGLFGIARDITVRKRVEEQLVESEAQYRSLFEGMLSGFAYHRVEYEDGVPVDITYLAVNANFEALTGLSDVVGKRITQVIPGLRTQDPDLFDIYFHVADTGEPARFEREVKSMGMWFAISVFSIQRGFFAVVFDNITDRVASETAMREKNDRLLQLNADLEQFTYASSHDLQTPLRNIVSYSQMLERRYKGRLDADADDFIEFIVSNSKQMTHLIGDLLEYSRATNQARPLASISAQDVVALALHNLKQDLEQGGIKVTVGDLPMVMADQTHLLSLFQNLLGNAIKYRSPQRSPVVSVTAVRQEADWWRFTIADNGIGIEPQYHDKIFEIFQRLSPLSETEGTGIGLTLCRRIVHRFGGSIWVESDTDKGAKFCFTLRDGSSVSSALPALDHS